MSSAMLTTGQLSMRPGYPSEWTMARWRRNNIGPAYTRIGGRVFYSLADVESWEKSHRAGGDEMPERKKRVRKPKATAGTADDTPSVAA
ncbi:hypothetical protein [Acidocella facilis]|uniref:hypothetical protein n=1 Tax=Acidocella facilis TaxID=525 RepID=UPI001F2F6A02|nr:hypothetical protein [Acidocella facilis]